MQRVGDSSFRKRLDLVLVIRFSGASEGYAFFPDEPCQGENSFMIVGEHFPNLDIELAATRLGAGKARLVSMNIGQFLCY